VAAGQDGSIALWVRVLSAAGAQQVNGADHARFPFWSPDSRYLGFFTAGKLKTVDVASGEAHILCGAPAGMGGSWSGDGTIVFAPNIAGPLYRIAAGGGVPAPITPIPVESSGQNHGGPWFLPDGKHFLYSALHSAPSDRQGNGIYIGSLGSTDVRLVSSGLAGKVAFSSGQLLYVQAGNLLAQPFDPKRFTTTGPPTVIAEQELDPDPGFWGSTFSVSQTGLLAFQSTADSMSHLVWTDESGKSLGQISEAWYKDPSLSPDGRLLAISSDDAHNGKRCIRVFDLARHIYRVAADGSHPPEVLLKGANMEASGWSTGGDLLLGRLLNGTPDLAVYSMSDHQVRQFAHGVEARQTRNSWL
jgi:WD40 repeat protein